MFKRVFLAFSHHINKQSIKKPFCWRADDTPTLCLQACADLEVIRRRYNFDNFFFLVDQGIEDPNSALNGPSSARLNGVSLAGPMMTH